MTELREKVAQAWDDEFHRWDYGYHEEGEDVLRRDDDGVERVMRSCSKGDAISHFDEMRRLAAADAAIAAVMEAAKELTANAYHTGWKDAVDDYQADGEPPHKDCAAEGYQNWLANEPALSLLAKEQS